MIALTVKIDVDFTSHEQQGLKMEGLAFNYKIELFLDSQRVLFTLTTHDGTTNWKELPLKEKNYQK
ncbi:MAG: hypothetical protein J0M15_13075 [Deltaproteobacteria bacterium]|nr:hypothetical protein [Deltaproteobacteria bacterium]